MSAPAKPDSQSISEQIAETLSVTKHAITIAGLRLRYTATAGRLRVPDQAGKPAALIFFVAYERNSENSRTRRPITFAFNGGPGASSMYLHLGAAGPYRAPFSFPRIPRIDALEENQYTWLTESDLVFVDPPGTGFSRAAPGVTAEQFYAVTPDITLMAEFIRLFLTRFERWTSPLFIAGESYGTTRAAGLCDYLQSAKAMVPEGLILLSSALDFETISFDPGNDLPFVLAVPSYAAAASYHNRLPENVHPKDVPALLINAETWARRDYFPALYQGLRMSDALRKKTIDSLAAYTGMPATIITGNGLRISQISFAQNLLSDRDSAIGILDSRISCAAGSTHNPPDYSDPSLYFASAAYATLINDYLRRDLGFRSPLEYVHLSDAVNRAWKWSTTGSQGYLRVTDNLLRAMCANARLRVFAGMGIYDLTTPCMSQMYAYEHLGSNRALLDRFTIKRYNAGHQMYMTEQESKQLSDDIKAFIAERQ